MAPQVNSYPAMALPLAETCPGVLDLTQRDPGRAGIDAQWREAFLLGAAPPTAYSIEAYRRARDALPDLYAVDVEEAINGYRANVGAGVIPTAHHFCYAVDGDLEGRFPAKGDVRIHTMIDCAWLVTDGKDVEGVDSRAVVLQHELSRLGSPSVTELDLAFAGIAMATLYKVRHMQLGRCFHSPGKATVFKWSPVIDEDGIGVYWTRISDIFRKRRQLRAGTQCERCNERRACPEWLFPVVHGGVLPAYRVLTGVDGPPHANDVPLIRRWVKTLRDSADVAEGQLRTLNRDGGA